MEPNKNKNQNNRDNNNMPGNNFGQTMMIILIAAVLAYLLMSTGRDFLRDSSEEEISYSEFYDMVESGEVESVEIGTGDRITVHPSEEAEDKNSIISYYTVKVPGDLDLVRTLRDHDVEITQAETDNMAAVGAFLIQFILPFALIFAFFFLLMAVAGNQIVQAGLFGANGKLAVVIAGDSGFLQAVFRGMYQQSLLFCRRFAVNFELEADFLPDIVFWTFEREQRDAQIRYAG